MKYVLVIDEECCCYSHDVFYPVETNMSKQEILEYLDEQIQSCVDVLNASHTKNKRWHSSDGIARISIFGHDISRYNVIEEERTWASQSESPESDEIITSVYSRKKIAKDIILILTLDEWFDIYKLKTKPLEFSDLAVGDKFRVCDSFDSGDDRSILTKISETHASWEWGETYLFPKRAYVTTRLEEDD